MKEKIVCDKKDNVSEKLGKNVTLKEHLETFLAIERAKRKSLN